MKLTITWLGQPKDVQTKYGPKQKNSLKAVEYGDQYLDFWLGSLTSNWKVGDVIEVEAVTDREYNGKTYYSITMPRTDNRSSVNPELLKTLNEIAIKVGKIDARMEKVMKHLSGEDRLDRTSEGTPVPFPDAEEDFNVF